MTMSRDANVAGVQAEPKEYTSGISLREVLEGGKLLDSAVIMIFQV